MKKMLLGLLVLFTSMAATAEDLQPMKVEPCYGCRY